MTGNEKQKFCDKCACSVHNLTGMKHQQIMKLREELGGKLWGAFHKTQPALKKPRRISLSRPLSLGVGISILALAACNSNNDEPLICNIAALKTSDNTPLIETPIEILGEIDHTIKLPPVKEPEIEIIGDVCPIEPDEQPLLLGKIYMPPKDRPKIK